MRYLLSYIYHFFISNSRHGTHSPFVYSLAEKVIYNPVYKSRQHVDYPEGFSPKYWNLLNKILSYWEVPNLNTDLKDSIAKAYWIEGPEHNFPELLNLVEQGKILIVHQPYQKAQKRLWKNLIADERVIVSINLFHFGIVLKRDGQRKEDFLLRTR